MTRNIQFTYEKLDGGITMIRCPMGENSFLLEGEDRALLIDTGMGIGNLKACVRGLTKLNVVVVNTHGHPDHAGGNLEFDECYMHPADARWYRQMCTREFRTADVRRILNEPATELCDALLDMAPMPLPIADGTEIDLGGRKVQVIATPGHTAGSICLLDCRTQALFAGDSLSANAVWMYDEYSEPLEALYRSLGLLTKRLESIGTCYFGHEPGSCGKERIEATEACARRVLMRDGRGVPEKTFAGEGLLYRYGGTAVLYNPDRLYCEKGMGEMHACRRHN